MSASAALQSQACRADQALHVVSTSRSPKSAFSWESRLTKRRKLSISCAMSRGLQQSCQASSPTDVKPKARAAPTTVLSMGIDCGTSGARAIVIDGMRFQLSDLI